MLLDESIRIPGIGYRIGYDAVIGLIPGLGDAVGLLLGSYIVIEAARFRVPKSTLIRMLANVVLEAIAGTVPIAGDLFDAVYKANLRNLRLLHKRLGEPESSPAGDWLFLSFLLLVPLAVVIGGIATIIYLVSLL